MTQMLRSRAKAIFVDKIMQQPASPPTRQQEQIAATSTIAASVLMPAPPASSRRDLSSAGSFTWSDNVEPHASRRREILDKHPEIADLFGVEPLTCPIVIAIVCIQVYMCYLLSSSSWLLLFILGWLVGGTLNHSLQLAVHELSHNLCFHAPIYNKCLAIFANLATGFPSSVSFQKYHMDHHQWQGVDGIDTDIPSLFEVNYFCNTLLKICWIILQPIFYAVRPTIIQPKPFGKWECINMIIQIIFNMIIIQYLGFKAFSYLVIGTILGLGLHPAAGHFIAEHYEFIMGQETYSYYGLANYVNFNVGYHNEHHDFPKIPWSRLPLVRQIAHEYYDALPHYTSYWAVFWTYVTDETLGPFARIKRTQKQQYHLLTNSSLSSASAASSSLSSTSVLSSEPLSLSAASVPCAQSSVKENNKDRFTVAFLLVLWFILSLGYVAYHLIKATILDRNE